MKEGDIFLTNDPWKGTGHLHDFTFVTPTFRRGKMVALFASTCHVVDIGGRGMTADARQVYEEGLYIPLMRFATRGRGRRDAGRHRRRQRARADPGGGRPLLAGDLQRDRLPPPDRDDGRVRHRRPRPAGHAHPREVAAGLARGDPQDQAGRVQVHDDGRRLRQADRPRRHHEDRRRPASTSTSPAPRASRRYGINVPLCYTEAYASLRREMHRGAQGAEQRGLAVGDPRHRARGLASSTPSIRRRSRPATSPARCCPT